MRLWLVAIGLVGSAGGAVARADTWKAEVEAGGEWDSNVHRVEVDPAGTRVAVGAPLARAGARVEGAGRAGAWGRWWIAGAGRVRTVTSDVRGEDVGALALDARWDRGLGDRRVRVGARASWYDATALTEPSSARTFALAAADGFLVLTGDGNRRFALSAGGRDFTYRPDADFDWHGAAVGARLVATVWRRGAAIAVDAPELADDLAALGVGDAAEATVELAVGWRLERRSYHGVAFDDGCAPGDPVVPACFVPTGERRSDLHHVGEVEATYTGDVVVTAGYELTVNDSSSYGQSLVRHRLSGSATIELPGQVYATGSAALQVDQYLDPLLLARDVVSQSFTSIDDENRSALAVRLSRRVGRGFTAEARWAFFADSLSKDDLEFRRQVVYGGLTWSSDD